MNAYNPWALLSDAGNGLAASGTWLRDSAGDKAGRGRDPDRRRPGGLRRDRARSSLVIAIVCVVVARRDDRWTILLAVTVLAIAFFVVPTRVHERYLFPVFALGAILAAVSVRWAWPTWSSPSPASRTSTPSSSRPFYQNPGVTDWLGIGPALRSPIGVTVIAVAHLAVFVWSP